MLGAKNPGFRLEETGLDSSRTSSSSSADCNQFLKSIPTWYLDIYQDVQALDFNNSVGSEP